MPPPSDEPQAGAREGSAGGTRRGRRGRRRDAEDGGAPKGFMHPSEKEFADLLDYYHINYLYEPRSFPLRWDGSRVVEMFTPDFYLPEYDQYFELNHDEAEPCHAEEPETASRAGVVPGG